MVHEQTFSLYRLKYFTVRTATQLQKSFLIMMAIIGALVSFPTLLTWRSQEANFAADDGSLFSFIFMAIVGGYYLTSIAFKEMHKPQTNILYLSLPVSAAECFWGNWLITGPLYLIAANLAAVIILGINAFACNLIWDAEVTMFHPFSESNLWELLKYMIFHAFFYWGAVFFKSKHFIKTFGTFILTGFVLLMIVVIIFGSVGEKMVATENPEFLNPDNFEIIASSIIAAFAMLFLFIAFRLIKRKQA